MSDNKYALLIASFDYDDPYFRQLKAPEQDVRALSRVLRDPAMGSFGDVKTLLNGTRDALLLGIEDFFDSRSTGDLLLLYFSGHGIKDEAGRLYYATKTTLHNRLFASAVPAFEVNDLIGKCRSRRKILILDCCYSGAFSTGRLAKGDDAVGVMEEFKQDGQGLVTLTASDAFQYSFEAKESGAGGACSVFTQALVDGIETGDADRDGDQLVSLDELYQYAYEKVRSECPQQTPRRSGDVEGDIVVARNPKPPLPCELPSVLQDAIENPLTEVREGAVRSLDKLLRVKNKGLSLAAYAALTKLGDEDDSFTVRSEAKKCVDAFGSAKLAEVLGTAVGQKGPAAPKETGPAAGQHAPAAPIEPGPVVVQQALAAPREAPPVAKPRKVSSPSAAHGNDLNAGVLTGSNGAQSSDITDTKQQTGKLPSKQDRGAPRSVADLIGASGPSVDWRRTFIFLVAISISPLISFAIHGFPSRALLLIGLASLIWVACTLGALRWVRNFYLAVVLAASVSAAASNLQGFPLADLGDKALVAEFVLVTLCGGLLGFIFLGALELALRLFSRTWVGLLLGSSVGYLCTACLCRLVNPGEWLYLPVGWVFLPMRSNWALLSLCPAAAFSIVYLLGLRWLQYANDVAADSKD